MKTTKQTRNTVEILYANTVRILLQELTKIAIRRMQYIQDVVQFYTWYNFVFSFVLVYGSNYNVYETKANTKLYLGNTLTARKWLIFAVVLATVAWLAWKPFCGFSRNLRDDVTDCFRTFYPATNWICSWSQHVNTNLSVTN